MKNIRYDLLSPDGFAIDREETYETPEKAREAFNKWIERYEGQGYYSTNKGRIPLYEVWDRMKLIELTIETE